MSKDKPARKLYPSDLTDSQWPLLAPLIPAAHPAHGGRPREVDRRDVVQTILSLNRSGCPWARLPHAWLPKSTVYDYCARWRDDGTWATRLEAWREHTRRHAGRGPTPSAACLDSPSVQTTEMGGAARGDDGGKKVNGRKRHLLIDTLGVLMVVLITRAGVDDGVAAPNLLQLVEPNACPRLDTIVADHTDHHHALHTWLQEQRPMWCIEVKTRPEGTKGFTPWEKRWVVERTNA